MIRAHRDAVPSSTAAQVPHRPPSRPQRPADTASAYDLTFWYTYAANTATMAAVSLLFRYADFVHFLGGTEYNLGWIVGAGMVGSLLMRLAQGLGIDTYGARQVWLWSSGLLVVSLLGHLWIERIDTLGIYLLRVLYTTSIAGIFGASITSISRRAPTWRIAEVVGTLGTSGFVGMVLGSLLGDYLLPAAATQRWQVDQMFYAAAGLGAASLVFAWLATRGHVPPERRKHVPIGRLLRRYHPGSVLLISVAMGVAIGLPHAFLRPYTEQMGIQRIAVFFGIYAPVAFVTRMLIRGLPARVGIRPMILAGMGSMIVGLLLYLTVRTEWQLVAPATCQGIAHAFLFPAVIAGGSSTFPSRYRGVGTTLVLAMFDLGTLFGAPAVGGILHGAAAAGLSSQAGYWLMFVIVAALMMLVTLIYGVGEWRAGRQTTHSRRRRRPPRRRARLSPRTEIATAMAEAVDP